MFTAWSTNKILLIILKIPIVQNMFFVRNINCNHILLCFLMGVCIVLHNFFTIVASNEEITQIYCSAS